MTNSVYDIPLPHLAASLVLILAVGVIYARWSGDFKTVGYATLRMLIQLLGIGFVLVYVFSTNRPEIVMLILVMMLVASSWISLRPLKKLRTQLYGKVIASLALGCFLSLFLVIFGVIRLKPWHEPRYLIPIASMIFSNAMNTVSLAAERFHSERERGVEPLKARSIAFQTGLLPLINSFLAVGVVSLPGMMTGQILAGVSPLLAARYQILVMSMLLGASGISAATYLWLVAREEKRAKK